MARGRVGRGGRLARIRRFVRSSVARVQKSGVVQVVLLVVQLLIWCGLFFGAEARGASSPSLAAAAGQLAQLALAGFGVASLIAPLVAVLLLNEGSDAKQWLRFGVGVFTGILVAEVAGRIPGVSYLSGGLAGELLLSWAGAVPASSLAVLVTGFVAFIAFCWSMNQVALLGLAGVKAGAGIAALVVGARQVLGEAADLMSNAIAAIGRRRWLPRQETAYDDEGSARSDERSVDDGIRVVPRDNGAENRAVVEALPLPNRREAERSPEWLPVASGRESADGRRTTSRPNRCADGRDSAATPEEPDPVVEQEDGEAEKSSSSLMSDPATQELLRKLITGVDGLSGAERAVVFRKARRIVGNRPATRPEVRHAVARAAREFQAIVGQARESASRVRGVRERVEDLVVVPDMDFDWIAGMEGLKQRLDTAIAGNFDPHKRAAVEFVTGAAPRGQSLLLHGAPGTGKTFFALAAAGEFSRRFGLKVINAPTEAVKGLHWSKHMSRLGEIFDLAESLAPCIVVWDELDGLASDPRQSQRKYDAQLATMFKQRMQGAMSTGRLIVHIGTTNFPEQLETALVRAGRFLPIHVRPPDRDSRRELIGHLLECHRVDDQIGVDELSDWSRGNTAAEIVAFIGEAAQKVAAENASRLRSAFRGIRREDLEQARKSLLRKDFDAYVKRLTYELGRERNADKKELFGEIVQARPRDEELEEQSGAA